eukprot:1219210-Prymnesium_polylepis.1
MHTSKHACRQVTKRSTTYSARHVSRRGSDHVPHIVRSAHLVWTGKDHISDAARERRAQGATQAYFGHEECEDGPLGWHEKRA